MSTESTEINEDFNEIKTENVTETGKLPESSEKFSSELIHRAIEFLINPKIIGSSLERKREFLRSKGLTEDEISYAISKSQEIIFNSPTSSSSSSPPSAYPYEGNYPNQMMMAAKPSSLAYVLSMFNYLPSMAIIVILAYGGYYFYRKYLYDRLNPMKIKRKQHLFTQIEEKLNELNQQLNEVRKYITQMETNLRQEIRKELHNVNNANSPIEIAAFNDLKNELNSIKALLLNRKQFPSTPKIPLWQLNEQQQQQTGKQENDANGAIILKQSSISSSTSSTVEDVDKCDSNDSSEAQLKVDESQSQC